MASFLDQIGRNNASHIGNGYNGEMERARASPTDTATESLRSRRLDRKDARAEQNNESNFRQSTRSTVVGKVKLMSYEDIVEAQAKRDAKEAVPVKGKSCHGRVTEAKLQMNTHILT